MVNGDGSSFFVPPVFGQYNGVGFKYLIPTTLTTPFEQYLYKVILFEI